MSSQQRSPLTREQMGAFLWMRCRNITITVIRASIFTADVTVIDQSNVEEYLANRKRQSEAGMTKEVQAAVSSGEDEQHFYSGKIWWYLQ